MSSLAAAGRRAGIRALGSSIAESSAPVVRSDGSLELPPGFGYDRSSQTVYDRWGRPDPYRSAEVRTALNLAQLNSTPAPSSGYQPVQSLPAAPVAPAAPVPPAAPAAPDPATQRAAETAQAAALVAQYGPGPAAARAVASQAANAGQSAVAGQWLDYAGQLEQWLASLRSTYNLGS